MPGAHRDGDSRYCGATTEATGNKVYVNGKLWAVDGDPNSHGEGNLKAVYGDLNIEIGGKKVIVAVGDKAGADKKDHPSPPTAPEGASGDVFAYGA